MSLPTLLALIVAFVGVPLNLYVTARLWRLSRANPGYHVLRERSIVALALTVILVVFAAIFVNNDLPIPFINTNETKLITRLVLLVAGIVPAAWWLWTYPRGTVT